MADVAGSGSQRWLKQQLLVFLHQMLITPYIMYQSSTPNTNPLWEDLVQSGRTDFVASNTLGDIMNSSNDPRRAMYFRNLDGSGAIIGNPHGAGVHIQIIHNLEIC